MTVSKRRLGRRSTTVVCSLLAALSLLGLSACSAASDGDATSTSGSQAGEWPRTIEHDAGTTEITEQPTTIVSTSVSLTGSILALDAPLVASAATSVNPLTDDQGFFTQWAEVAEEKEVEVLYSNLELDLEAVESYEPDLIIGSTVGGDSTLEAYDQLSEIAPTILLDYGSVPWTDLTEIIGEATGLEDNAATVEEDFNDYVAEQAESVEAPDEPAALITYQGADGIGMFTESSPQGVVFTELGFEFIEVQEDLASETHADAYFFTEENTPLALGDAEQLFVVPFGGDPLDEINDNELLDTVPAVESESLYAVPASAFRLDPYSAEILVDYLVEQFGE